MATNPVKSLNLRFVSRASLPVIGRGATSTEPSVTVHPNGQISFNTLASKILSVPQVIISIDPKSREVYVLGATEAYVKKNKIAEDLIYPMKTSKKGGTYSFAATPLLSSVADFGGVLYDYRQSGVQSFKAVPYETENMIVFQLPEGMLTPKVKAPRKPRVEKDKGGDAAGTQTANGVNGAVVPSGGGEPEELLLNA